MSYIFISWNYSLCTLKRFTYFSMSSRLMSTLTRNNRSTWIIIFNIMMVKYLTMINSLSNLSSSHSTCRFGVLTYKPISNIEVVNMLFNNMITTEPIKVIPISHLIFHFRLTCFSFSNPHSCTIPVNLTGDNFTNVSFFNFIE